MSAMRLAIEMLHSIPTDQRKGGHWRLSTLCHEQLRESRDAFGHPFWEPGATYLYGYPFVVDDAADFMEFVPGRSG